MSISAFEFLQDSFTEPNYFFPWRRYYEPEIAPFLMKHPRRFQHRLKEARHLMSSASGKQSDERGITFQRLFRTVFYNIDQGMTHEFDVESGFSIDFRFEREYHHHFPTPCGEFGNIRFSPCPDLRAYVPDHGNVSFEHLFCEADIKARIIDKDYRIGTFSLRSFDQREKYLYENENMLYDLDAADHAQFRRIDHYLDPRVAHLPAAHPGDTEFFRRKFFSELLGKFCTVNIARRFSGKYPYIIRLFQNLSPFCKDL